MEAAVQPTPPQVKPWPVSHLRAGLLDADDSRRIVALAMAVMPEAPAAECVPELIDCTRLSDPTAQLLAAVALGGTPSAGDSAQALARLLGDAHQLRVRVAAAHGLFRLGLIPEAAYPGLARLLATDDPAARRVAQLALSRADVAAGSAVAEVVGETPTQRWNIELLASLGHFTRGAEARRRMDSWLMGQLADAPLLPSGIAGYVALAKINEGGPALDALTQIVRAPAPGEAGLEALQALGNLGEVAKPCAARLAEVLHQEMEPGFEVRLCQTLVNIRAKPSALPLDVIVRRVEAAEPRVAAAHAMLLSMGGKAFAKTKDVLRRRHAAGPQALRASLANAYEAITGQPIAE